jgi:hypothetical protein
MKKILLLILGTSVFAASATATVRTVSNDVNSPGQFTSLQAAHDASAANDTIYIHPSATYYDNLTLTKPLVLIGGGSMPGKQVQYASKVLNITVTFATLPSTSGSGSKIYGLSIDKLIFGSSSSAYTSGVGSITVSRNKIQNITITNKHNNLVLFQNVIGAIGSENAFPSLWNNCVFSNNICGGFQPYPGDAGANNLISNNQFDYYFYISGAVISNNIFYSSATLYFVTYSSTFSNNIFLASTPVNSSDIIKGSTTGTGNLFNVDPVLTTSATSSQINGYTYTSPAAGPFANLHLQATSPGKDYGTDGTDVGIYGGGYPWVDGESADSRFRYYPMPNQVPHMIEMNILNPTLPVDGTLNVDFNAKTKN